MTPAAERQRRSRAHRRGDHQFCPPGRAECAPSQAAPAVTDAPSLAPDLGARGRRLWSQVTDGAELGPTALAVLEEACRTADRLDKIDRILTGDNAEWMRFRSNNDDGSVVRVVLTHVLAEARQQQIAFAGLLDKLRVFRADSEGRAPTANEGGEVANVTNLAARIADRRRAASSG